MRKLGIICMVLGVVLVFGAAGLVFYNSSEEQIAEKTSEEYLGKIKERIAENIKSKTEEVSADISASNSDASEDNAYDIIADDNSDSSVSQPNDSEDNSQGSVQETTEDIPEDVHRDNNLYVSNMLVAEIDGFKFVGYITIPQLGIQLPVLSETDMAGMKSFPCRFSGSPKTDNLVVGAHNYSVHFGSISELWQGDTVTFDDMEGNTWRYSVVFSEVLNPTDVDMLILGEYPLSIYTCNYDGSQRITVRCERAQ